MQLQEMLWTVGGLAIAGLTWTAARSWLDASRQRLRLRLEPVEVGPTELPNPELPGRARVVNRAPMTAATMAINEEALMTSAPDSWAEESGSLTSHAVPMHAETLANAASGARTLAQQDLFGADEPVTPPPPRSRPNRARALYAAEESASIATEPAARPEPVHERAKPRKSHHQPQEVIALHVLPTRAPWQGEDLMRTILSFGLRYGEMAIFHRHELPTGQGDVLFSMANAMSPGTFDLEALPSEEIHGVSFFLTLPGVNSISAFELLVDTARRVAHDLGGEVLDSSRSLLTQQLIVHYREKVQDFERRRLMQLRQSTEA